MSSPKTTWSGFIEMGMIPIPITVAKATGDPERVSEIVKEVNVVKEEIHPIDRRWRDAKTLDLVDNKQRAVQISEDEWRLIPDDEWEMIEEATKTPTLRIIDVQPASRLPLLYTQSTYYVRHDKNSKMQPTALAHLIAAMTAAKMCLVCKWGSTHRQRLCVLSAEAGVMVMRQIPFLSEVRVASKMERAHMSVKIEPKMVRKFTELLGELHQEKFDYGSFSDDGVVLRQEAVERILDGEVPEFPDEPDQEPINLWEALETALAEMKG